MNFFIFIGNWNLSGKELDNELDIINWLTSYKDNNLCPEEIDSNNIDNLNINNLGKSNILNSVNSFRTFNNEQNYIPDIMT